MADQGRVIIVGGGIGGLVLALELHAREIPFTVCEAVREFKPLGVGLNMLPHAMRTFARLELDEELMRRGIPTRELRWYTRNGQLVQSELRGRFAGYPWPQLSLHRGDLHETLVGAVIARCGSDAIRMGHDCVGVDQDEDGAIVLVRDAATGESLPSLRGGVAIAADGVGSAVRRQMHPGEAVPRYEGSLTYRGTTRWKPFLGGDTMVYFGTREDGGVFVVYPVRDNIDAAGRQLVNWAMEVDEPEADLARSWNKRSSPEKAAAHFRGCSFEWLDIEGLVRAADQVFEYPMVDQEAVDHWTKGRIALLGDAAHPIMPKGSNGGAQAIIDATTLADLLAASDDWPSALNRYEASRMPELEKVLAATRTMSPDAILRVVRERTGGNSFESIDDVIAPEEREAWQERYKSMTGFSRREMAQPA